MAKVKFKGAFTVPKSVPEFVGNYFRLVNRNMDFMQDENFKPNDTYLDTYPLTVNGYSHDAWDVLYRSRIDLYRKDNHTNSLNQYEGLPFPAYQNYVYKSVDDVANGIQRLTLLKDVPKYPTAMVGVYKTNPLSDVIVKMRLPIKDWVKEYSRTNLDTILSPEDPITNQQIEERSKFDNYLKYSIQLMTQDINEECENQRQEGLAIAVNLYTSTDYQYDLWNDVTAFNSVFNVDLSAYPEGTACDDVFPGLTDIKFKSYVNRERNLPETGDVGDMIVLRDDFNGGIYGNKTYYAWDAVNNVWSIDLFEDFIANIYTTQRSARDAKMKAFNEFSQGIVPFVYAAKHLPAFKINKDLI